jgi:hypothetical protein
MSAVAQKVQLDVGVAANVLDAFLLRCWARAYLVECGKMDLQDAVDGLQDFASLSGFEETLGQDAVQAIMAKAFDRKQAAR